LRTETGSRPPSLPARAGRLGLGLGVGLAALLLAAGCAGVDRYEVELERGEVALRVGDTEDAADAYRRALAYRRDGPEGLHGLARSHVAQGDGESAIGVFARLERADPDYFRERVGADYHFALYQAAKSRLRRGDSARALELLRRLERLDPEHSGLTALRTQVLIAEGGRLQVAGRSEEAEVLFREALGGDESGAAATLGLAETLMESGRLDTAITVLSDALLRHPEDPRLQALMDRALEIRYPEGLPRRASPGSGGRRR
jgi:predicted Zn-dependent protease